MTDLSKRGHELLKLLQTGDTLSVEDACKHLEISPATARREFARLEEIGAVDRFWGGIRLPVVIDRQLPVSLRKNQQQDEKQRIAKAASALVNDGDVIIIDGGTTTAYMAAYLADRPVRVITNSILIAYEFDRLRSGAGGAEILLTGGMLYRELGLLTGLQTRENLKQYHAQKAFISVGALDAEYATNHNQPVVDSEQVIIEQADELMLLADHTKIGVTHMCRICPITKAHTIVTNHHDSTNTFFQQPVFADVNIVKA